jgi:hypothetical protein
MGAWAEAEMSADIIYSQIPDTTWDRPKKLGAGLRAIAASHEKAVADGDSIKLRELSVRWKTTLKEFETDRETYKRRRDPLHGILGED